jgi:WD40 repeat protein
MQHQGWVLCAEFSPDGKRVVTASRDKKAQVWDSATGSPVGAAMQHQGWVLSAEFSPDGKRIVTASRDNTARVGMRRLVNLSPHLCLTPTGCLPRISIRMENA